MVIFIKKGAMLKKISCLSLLYICQFLSLSTSLLAQESDINSKHSLLWRTTPWSDSATVAKLLPNLSYYKDTTACNEAIAKLLLQLQQRGYMSASIDSFKREPSHSQVLLYLGQPYPNATIELKGIDKRALQRSRADALLRKGNTLPLADIDQLQSRILQYAENNGYPFAQIQWQNARFDQQSGFHADLLCQFNKAVRLDTLLVEGKVRISRRYLWRYLHLSPNALYSEADIRQASMRLRELPFLQEMHPPTVQFSLSNKAKITLFVKPRKASRFDFLLGILPNGKQTAGSTAPNYQITGEGWLNLQNALGAGELLELQFKNYPNNIKELKTRVAYPYLPLLPIGGDAKFELYLRDTLFRNVQSQVGLQYLLRGNNYWKVYVQWLSSDMLSVDTARLALSKILPAVLDTRSTIYGIAYNFERLDYRLNPRRGTTFYVNLGIGKKLFKPNAQIIGIGENIETNFTAQYDSLNQQAKLLGQVEARAAKFWAVGKNSTFYTALNMAWKPPNITLFNETYRIGGSKLLRGFNEESILATFYSLATLEYRYLLGQNAATFAFCDMAYTENRSRNAQAAANQLLSFGLGINFETKAGIFGLTYALGKQQGNAFDFRAGKIHFAYLNYF